MIKFGRLGKDVTVKVEHGVFYSDEYFTLEIHQVQEYQAELLRKQLQENLNRHLRELKEKYYNEGWKNAKAKTRKKQAFYGGWEK